MKRKTKSAGMLRSCALAAVVAVLAANSAASAGAPNEVRLEPFLKTGLLLHATVAGRQGTFLFDSGSGVSNITPGFAAAIGCTPWGQISGFTMSGQRLDMQRCDGVDVGLAGTKVRLDSLGVFDVNKLMPAGTTPTLDGTIALDVFAGRALAISYSRRTLTLLNADSLARLTRGQHAMRVHLVRDAEGLALSVNMPVTTTAGTAWFELDSGNTSPFLIVGKHLAKLFGLDAESRDPQSFGGALADGSAFQGKAKVSDLILDGNLGVSFLSRYDVTLDLASARSWVTPAR